MPRTRKFKFNSAWEDNARKTAKNKKRGGGDRFTKRDALDCKEVCSSPIQNIVVSDGSEPFFGVPLSTSFMLVDII
jgi:hypothetical protein